jgi:hypothetical protein
MYENYPHNYHWTKVVTIERQANNDHLPDAAEYSTLQPCCKSNVQSHRSSP